MIDERDERVDRGEKTDIMMPNIEKITRPVLTKYEIARIIGSRANQIAYDPSFLILLNILITQKKKKKKKSFFLF